MKRLQLLALCLLLPPLCWLGPALAQETPEHQSGEEEILEILDNEVAAASPPVTEGENVVQCEV